MPEIKILGDSPTTEDGLGFDPYVNILLEAINNIDARSPLTIGIHGRWGSGKTSLMKMLKKRFKDDNKVKTIWFNAWAHGREESIGLALLQQVLIEFQNGEKTKVKFAEFGRSFSKLLADAALRKTTGISFEEAKELFKNSIEVKNTLRGDFEEVIKESEVTRLVVFIDDLDRCLPEKTIEILEVIKLFLDVPRCVFVIGVAKEVIEQGIEVIYKPGEQGIPISGQDYIEKIIQVPFNLPPIRVDDMISFIESQGISGKEKEYAEIVAKGTECNPRTVKLFLNTLRIRQEIAAKSGGELEPAVAAKLLVIEYTFPEFYSEYVVKHRKDDFICKFERLAKREDDKELRKELESSKIISEAVQKYGKEYDLKNLLRIYEPSFCGIDIEPYIYLSGKPPEEVFVLEESIIDELLSLDPKKSEDALSKIKDNPKLVDEIIMKLKEDKDKSERRKAAEALGIIKNPKAVVALIEALKKDEEETFVRGEAAGALGRIGDENAVGPLEEALRDRRASVRLYAKNALDEIKTKRESE
ncbi:MAG: HEAT repeat domain-containing protein [Candidatus Marinimicrobia bacterium]|nr:HEAT repeat domain-containing protein [Candidatus Neomarinimicrobiota bacterium]